MGEEALFPYGVSLKAILGYLGMQITASIQGKEATFYNEMVFAEMGRWKNRAKLCIESNKEFKRLLFIDYLLIETEIEFFALQFVKIGEGTK